MCVCVVWLERVDAAHPPFGGEYIYIEIFRPYAGFLNLRSSEVKMNDGRTRNVFFADFATPEDAAFAQERLNVCLYRLLSCMFWV